MDNTQFVKDCLAANVNQTIKKGSLTFDELFNLKYPAEYPKNIRASFWWWKFQIYATTKKKFKMDVWNGVHPVEKNTTTHVCKPGTKVRVWMVSRMGDVGITDNIVNPKGYDTRIAIEDLENWEIIKVAEIENKDGN